MRPLDEVPVRNDPVALEAIRRAVGPAPWYWKTFPSIATPSGELLWLKHGEIGRPDHFIALHRVAERNPRLLLGTHCRAFSIPPSLLGIWFPEESSIRVLCFDPGALPLLPVPVKFSRLNLRYYADAEPLIDIIISNGLSSGCNRARFPSILENLDELLTVQPYPAVTENSPLYAVFSIRPGRHEITVMPQRWFVSKEFSDWQWITRVARHPLTGRVVGDGIRLFKFELTEDGCDLAARVTNSRNEGEASREY